MDLAGVKTHILNRLQNELDDRLTYHNCLHTRQVHDAVMTIAPYEKIDEQHLKILGTAALFHDAGMLEGYDNHEERSASLAATTLPDFGYSEEEISEICSLILATRMPQSPMSHLQKILCDADLDYLGTPSFFARSFDLKLEWEIFMNEKHTLREWFEKQIAFLENHQYFTEYEQIHRKPLKEEHIREMKRLVRGEDRIEQ